MLLTIFAKGSVLDVGQDSEYIYESIRGFLTDTFGIRQNTLL